MSSFALTDLAAVSGGLLVGRLVLGPLMAAHGTQKLFGWFGGHGISGTGEWMESIGIPFGTLSALLAGATEFGGGLALLAGLFVGWASIPLTLTMVVGALTAHTGFSAQAGGMEYPLTLAAVVAGLGLTGPGRLTLAGIVPGVRRTGTVRA
jgi:putative oxidoreductase